MRGPQRTLVFWIASLTLLSLTSATTKYEWNNFWEKFDGGNEGLLKKYWFSGYWGNGQPFNVGWDPSYFNINQYDVLELLLKKVNYFWKDYFWAFTAGEMKSRDFYGNGMLSVPSVFASRK